MALPIGAPISARDAEVMLSFMSASDRAKSTKAAVTTALAKKAAAGQKITDADARIGSADRSIANAEKEFKTAADAKALAERKAAFYKKFLESKGKV